jgi:hypothetical protein
MYLTGNIKKVFPLTKSFAFELDNLFLFGTGTAQIGFSGYGSPSGQDGTFYLTLTNDKLYDNSGMFVWGYDKPFNLRGEVVSGQSQLFINGEPLRIESCSPNWFNILSVTLDGASGVNADVYLYTPAIPISISVSPTYLPGGELTVDVTNNSDMDVLVFGYDIQFTDNTFFLPPPLSGIISGMVFASGTSHFNLFDTSNTQDDKTYQFDLFLNTSLGQVAQTFFTSSVSGFNYIVPSLSKLSPDPSIPTLFYDVTGLNTLTFESNPAQGFLAARVSKFNVFTQTDGTGVVHVDFSPGLPATNIFYTHEYVTGFEVTVTGFYDSCPNAEFTQYYSVRNFDFGLNIFTTGCPVAIPLLFSGINGIGSGASGWLYLNPQPVVDQVVYGSIISPAYFYIATGFEILDKGSGYVEPPFAYLGTGGGCSDYTLDSGVRFPFSAFAGLPVMGLDAGYLTGFPICGATGSGYYLQGLIFTNPGSGYSSAFYPKVSFVRQSGDMQVGDASGVIVLNSTHNHYVFNDVWQLSSGLNAESLSPVTGSVIPYSGETPLYFGLTVNPIPYTGIMTAIVTLTADGSSISFTASGYKAYSTNPKILMTDLNYFSDSSSVLNFLNQGLT